MACNNIFSCCLSQRIKAKSYYIEQASKNLGKHTYALEWSDLSYDVEVRRLRGNNEEEEEEEEKGK